MTAETPEFLKRLEETDKRVVAQFMEHGKDHYNSLYDFAVALLTREKAKTELLEDIAQQLVDFQHEFEVKAMELGRMPGNDYYSDKQMKIVREAQSLLEELRRARG